MKKLLSSLLALLITSTLSANLFAQSTGKITGKIIDQKTSETLIGATVMLQGTTKGAAANVDGQYALTGVAAGKYTVVVQYVGYQSKAISDVVVKSGDVTNLDIALGESKSQALNEVVIKATYRQASVASLYAVQKNSVSISDGISSEIIRRSPDKTTGDVLKRVSGTTIQDNKFVIVRGLSDRYNNAMLDGTPLPSTEPNRKAFSFDIIPANLIDNITITKTASPDMPADFAGGTVQIFTKDIPDQNFISIGAGYSYNTQSTFKNFKSGYRNPSDYFGFDGGARKLLDGFPKTDQIVNRQLTPDQNKQSINSLNNNFDVYNKNAFLGQSYQFTLGNVQEIGKNKNRFGTTIALTYRNSELTTPDIIRAYDNFNYRDDQYRFTTSIGALANFGYSFGGTKITFKNLYNRIFDDLFTYRTGTNNSSSATDNRFYAYDLMQKSLLKSTLEGEHKIGSKSAKINWNLGYSNIINDQPDQRKVNYVQQSTGDDYVASVTGIGKENTRFFSYLKEDIYSGKVDYKMPVKLFNQTSNLKVGVSSQYRDRRFDARFIGLVLNEKADYDQGQAIIRRPIETLFGRNAINGGFYDLAEIPNPSDRYTAHSFTNAGYLMLDNKISENFRAVYGVRVETFDLELKTKETDQKQPRAQLKQTSFLPSVNLTYNLTPKANLRASYYRTLVRPEFRELAPFSYYDYEIFAIQDGNPNLKITNIDNADLRYELYPSAGEILSFSAFYKKFYNAIEPSIDDNNSTTTISYINRNAIVYGFEMEARKKLDFISDAGFYKNTTVYANLSITKSEVKQQAPNLELTRPMVGQSPYVINAGVQHMAFDNKLSINALYNRLGRRIFYAGGNRLLSVWENPRDVLDVQIG
ncbi:MAG: TonB-dependent receptor, partial [Sphingobacteriaceae bacterium]